VGRSHAVNHLKPAVNFVRLVTLRNSAFCHSVYLCVLHDSCTKYSINCLVFLIERDCSL